MFRWTADFYPGFDMEYAESLAKEFGLDIKKKLKGLSTGYLTISKLITALACPAPYVIFDEPVLGLDANHRELFYRRLIENYAARPRPVECGPQDTQTAFTSFTHPNAARQPHPSPRQRWAPKHMRRVFCPCQAKSLQLKRLPPLFMLPGA